MPRNFSSVTQTGNDLLRSILDANEAYADEFAQADPILLKKLATGQSPSICWLGCSDSRVSAELSTGVAPGSIFVHRNVAQCFHEGDPSALAALTYAVNVLNVESIIVCGHTGCGGVAAGMMAAAAEEEKGGKIEPKNEHERIVGNWIAPIKQIAVEQLKQQQTSDAKSESDTTSARALAKLTDEHVKRTVKAVADSKIVTEAWESGKELSVHGWVYHVATAKLRDLDCGFKGPGIPCDSLKRANDFDAAEYSEHLHKHTQEEKDHKIGLVKP